MRFAKTQGFLEDYPHSQQEALCFVEKSPTYHCILYLNKKHNGLLVYMYGKIYSELGCRAVNSLSFEMFPPCRLLTKRTSTWTHIKFKSALLRLAETTVISSTGKRFYFLLKYFQRKIASSFVAIIYECVYVLRAKWFCLQKWTSCCQRSFSTNFNYFISLSDSFYLVQLTVKCDLCLYIIYIARVAQIYTPLMRLEQHHFGFWN